MYRILHWLIIGVIWVSVLANCGSTPLPPVATLYPDAVAAQATDAALAAVLLDGTGSNVSEAALQAAQLYRIPDMTTYVDVKSYYQREMSALGWQPDDAILIEGDTLSYVGWRRDNAVFVVGVVENVAGDGAYMTTALFVP